MLPYNTGAGIVLRSWPPAARLSGAQLGSTVPWSSPAALCWDPVGGRLHRLSVGSHSAELPGDT
jgi:hypothetical protein